MYIHQGWAIRNTQYAIRAPLLKIRQNTAPSPFKHCCCVLPQRVAINTARGDNNFYDKNLGHEKILEAQGTGRPQHLRLQH